MSEVVSEIGCRAVAVIGYRYPCVVFACVCLPVVCVGSPLGL